MPLAAFREHELSSVALKPQSLITQNPVWCVTAAAVPARRPAWISAPGVWMHLNRVSAPLFSAPLSRLTLSGWLSVCLLKLKS